MEVAESLNIHLDNLDFSGMYPEVKEDTLDFSRMKLEVKEDNPTLTEINLEVDPEVRKKLEIYPGVKEEETELQNCTSETFKDIATSEASAGIHTDEGMIEHTKIESKTNELQVENNSVTETKIAEKNRPASEASVSAGPQYPTQEDLDQAKANILKDGKSFGSRFIIHDRKDKNRTKTLPYKCDVCGYEFNQKGNMKTHKINKHQYQPPKTSSRVKINSNIGKEPFLHQSNNVNARYEAVTQAFESVGNEGVKKSNIDLIKVKSLQKPFRVVNNPPTQVAAQKLAFSNVHSKVESLQKPFIIVNNPPTTHVITQKLPFLNVYAKVERLQKSFRVVNKGIGDAGSTADFRML